MDNLIVHARWLADFVRWGDWIQCLRCGDVVDRSEVEAHRALDAREIPHAEPLREVGA